MYNKDPVGLMEVFIRASGRQLSWGSPMELREVVIRWMGSWCLPKESWVVVSNIFYFHPYLGKWSNLTNIFQLGWSHQPVRIQKYWRSIFCLCQEKDVGMTICNDDLEQIFLGGTFRWVPHPFFLMEILNPNTVDGHDVLHFVVPPCIRFALFESP